jgi:hypothetical protein
VRRRVAGNNGRLVRNRGLWLLSLALVSVTCAHDWETYLPGEGSGGGAGGAAGAGLSTTTTTGPGGAGGGAITVGPRLDADAVAFFPASACPTGWSVVDDARGRVVVGVGHAGAVGAVVGASFAVDGQVISVSGVVAHSHEVDPPAATSSPEAHGHSYGRSSGHDSTGGAGGPLQSTNQGGPGTIATSVQSHTHAVSLAITTEPAGSATPADATTPYVELLACRPDSGAPRAPGGAVAFFAGSACPSYWTDRTDAHGRVIVGLHAGGALAATHGSALADQAARTLTEVPEHTHEVLALSVTTASESHDHTVSVATAHDGDGGNVRIQQTDASTGSTNSASGSHQHALDVPPFESDVTGVASVDVTMPYVQLLVCEAAAAPAPFPAEALPADTILFFSADTCPDGWQLYAAAQGRTPLGLPVGGLPENAPGSALGDQGGLILTDVFLHTHTGHADATTASQSHSHDLPIDQAHDTTGGGSNDVQGVDLGANGTYTLGTTAHEHHLAIAGFQTAPAGSAAVDVAMPYVQFLACQKL